MAHSLEHIREHIKIAETTNNKGLALTLVVTAYDNGMLHIGNTPVRSGPLNTECISALGWLQCVANPLAVISPNFAAKWSIETARLDAFGRNRLWKNYPASLGQVF